MADQLLLARQFDDNGAPGAGYVASFFLSGTTTPETVYTDTGVSIPAGTSVTANAAGRFAQTFHPGGVSLKCVITTPLGATVETLDPVPAVSISAGAAEDISFSPTGSLPYDNVQDAIEGSVAAAASGFNAFGLGITGNAATLANIDATNISTGVYNFDGTTAGTFPTGSAAANGGTVEMWRRSAAGGFMRLYDSTVNRHWWRRLSSSTWQPWFQILTATPGTNAAAITGIQTTINDSDADLPTSGAVLDLINGRRYVSSVVPIALGGLYTFTHGLGQLPTDVTGYFVCKSAIDGYAVGERVPFTQGLFNFDSNSSPAITVDATQIRVRIASNNLMVAIKMDGGARTSYGPANFDLQVTASI